MKDPNFLAWLFSEARAEWVSGIISFVGFLVSMWFKNRPKRRMVYEARFVRGAVKKGKATRAAPRDWASARSSSASRAHRLSPCDNDSSGLGHGKCPWL